MGKSKGRERHFEKYIKTCVSPRDYAQTLKLSPYSQHKKAGQQIELMVEDLEDNEITRHFKQLQQGV